MAAKVGGCPVSNRDYEAFKQALPPERMFMSGGAAAARPPPVCSPCKGGGDPPPGTSDRRCHPPSTELGAASASSEEPSAQQLPRAAPATTESISSHEQFPTNQQLPMSAKWGPAVAKSSGATATDWDRLLAPPIPHPSCGPPAIARGMAGNVDEMRKRERMKYAASLGVATR